MIFEFLRRLFVTKDSVPVPAFEITDVCENVNEKRTKNDSADSINLLVITDAHGKLKTKCQDLFSNLTSNPDFILLLGDNYYEDLEYIISQYKANGELCNVRILGIVGNHDDRNLLDNFPDIIQMDHTARSFVIHDRTITVGGLSGSVKYKDNNTRCLRTHKESVDLLMDVGKCDILMTHDKPCFELPEDDEYDELCTNAHSGLYGIGKYILENGPGYMVHGHLHERYVKRLRSIETGAETFIRCCYMVEQFSIQI